MHILINRTAAAPGTSGHVHLVETAAAFSRIGADARFTVMLTPRQRVMAEQLPANFSVEMRPLAANGAARSLQLQRDIPAFVRRTHVDVLFNPGNFFVARPGCAQVCLVENANVFSHPSIPWRPVHRAQFFVLRQITRLALRYADDLVFPSRDAAEGFAAAADVRPPVTIAPHGWRSGLHPGIDRPRQLAGRFVLCVASVLPHKNLERLVAAFRQLVDRHGYPGNLAIVGYAAAGPYRGRLDAAIAGHRLNERIAVLPPLGAPELAATYAAADAVVNPSLEESFGIPAIEAMGYGRPQSLSDTSLARRGRFFNPFRELCGEAAEYFDPFDVAGMADAMAATLDPVRVAPRIEEGRRRVERFTWDATAQALWNVFTRHDARRLPDPAGTRASSASSR